MLMNPEDPANGASREQQNTGGQPPVQQAAPTTAPVAPVLPSPADEQADFYRPESPANAPVEPDYAPMAYDPRQVQPQPQEADLRMQHDGQGVTWTAPEFIQHPKTPEWFLIFVAVTLVFVVGCFLLTGSLVSTIGIALAGVIFGVAANRAPRMRQYAVHNEGVSIGARTTYPYSNFRSFSVIDEEGVPSIVFLPLKRFMPPLTIYYDQVDEDAIVDELSAHLPMHEHQFDLTEQLMRKIRF